jgi:hypothetical protein
MAPFMHTLNVAFRVQQFISLSKSSVSFSKVKHGIPVGCPVEPSQAYFAIGCLWRLPVPLVQCLKIKHSKRLRTYAQLIASRTWAELFFFREVQVDLIRLVMDVAMTAEQ